MLQQFHYRENQTDLKIENKTHSRISRWSCFSKGHLKNMQGPRTTSRKPNLFRLSLSLCHTQTIHSTARKTGSSGDGR